MTMHKPAHACHASKPGSDAPAQVARPGPARNEYGRSDVNMAAEQISRVKIDPALFGVGDPVLTRFDAAGAVLDRHEGKSGARAVTLSRLDQT